MRKGILKKIVCAGTSALMIAASIPMTVAYSIGQPDSNGDYFTNSFESGVDDWSGRGSASVTTNSKNYYDGAKSLYVSGRESEWSGASLVLDSDTFSAGGTYSFSAAVLQTSGAEVTIQMSLQQGEGDSATYCAAVCFRQ